MSNTSTNTVWKSITTDNVKLKAILLAIGMVIAALSVVIMLQMATPANTMVTSQSTSPSVNNRLFAIPNDLAGVVSNGYTSMEEATPSMNLAVMLSLKYQNQQQLSSFLVDVQNPTSPYYHHYLTQAQFITLYSPSSSIYNAFVNYFTSKGIQVTTYTDRVSIFLEGTVAQFDSAFHTKIMNIHVANSQVKVFHAPVQSLSLDSSFPYAGAISHINGLNDQWRAHVAFTGSGSNELLYGADLQAGYQLNTLFSAKGYPTNLTVATILWSGQNSAGQNVGPYVPSDISYYFSHNLPSGEPVPQIYGDPVGGAPQPGTNSAKDSSQANYESTLDLQMAGSTAPGASIVEVYGPQATNQYLDQAFAEILNPSATNCYSDQTGGTNTAACQTALQHVVAISNSWGGTDSQDTTWQQYEQQAASRGITVLASSGDNGNSNGQVAPSFPATATFNTYGAIAVGGTATVLSGTTSTDGSGTTGISSQSVWYNTPAAGDGSQGGVSSVFAEPSFQTGSADANGVITGASSITGVSSGRGTPDVAGIGANMEIYITPSSGSASYITLWGTSVASPLTAGEIATMDYYMGSNEGFMLPTIYQLGQAQYTGSYSTAPPFNDVTSGANGAFSAATGYDLATGWGSINAYNFIQAQQGTSTTYTVTFTESGLTSGTSWSVTFNGNTQSSTTTTITFSNVASGTYSYSVGAVSGYTSSPSSGSLTVSTNVNQAITFTANSGTSAIYSEVTSTSISTYSLNEAEEFTVGSSTVQVNFVSVYLGGSGSATVSIGTTLWGTNVVAAHTVSISSQGWYNVTFPTVTLNGNTNYYLNVQTASGSPTWGYTTSPSSTSKNYVQDYWYSGSTLYNDNSYPNIYEVGYQSSTPPPPTYTVTFTESGLPSGTSWSVTLGGSTKTSTTATITFSEPNGGYSFTVGTITGYSSSPSSGSITVNGANVNQAITFTAIPYSVTFTESGLPSGTSWSATFNGNTQSSTTTTITFSNIIHGTYSYSIGAVSGYTASPSSGSITVSGANVNQAITFSSSTQTAAIYSQVTSTSISTYSLPEAEEFTVGSSNAQVNYITLYLSGSGSVTVSIGSTLWGTDKLAAQTVTLVSGQTSYTINFASITLAGSTNYYLIVQTASGSPTWGYTTSPSSTSKNYVQDYWYSGSTLYNDNSYPNIYTIGNDGSGRTILSVGVSVQNINTFQAIASSLPRTITIIRY